MRKSKWQLVRLAIGVLFAAFLFSRIPGGDLFTQGLLWVSLVFGVWAATKFYRDYQLSQDSPVTHNVSTDHQAPPQLMSKGSRGLPTSFD